MMNNIAPHPIVGPTVIAYRKARMNLGSKDILLARLGDFYEAFDDDARTLAKVLTLTLTRRGEVPMAGIPYHAVDNYTKQLEAAGFNVVLLERLKS